MCKPGKSDGQHGIIIIFRIFYYIQHLTTGLTCGTCNNKCSNAPPRFEITTGMIAIDLSVLLSGI